MKNGSLSDRKILFVGAGNMAEALTRGIIKAGLCDAACVRVSDVDAEKLARFKTKYEVAGSFDNSEEVKNADIIVLAVKPQILPKVLEGIKESVSSKSLVISIAAGITIKTIESGLNEGARVVRVMPNSPALVGRGAAAFACGSHTLKDDEHTVQTIFSSVGLAVSVEESALDAVTALSGSGPAYVFYIVEAMLKAGAEMGLNPETARALTVATVEGAGRMLAETSHEPAELRRNVTSPGGTTAAAIETLERSCVGERMFDAVIAARDRSKELSGMR